MNHQRFYRPVGQVAGGDINNYGFDNLSELSQQELEDLRLHMLERLSDARKRIIYNPIVAWMTAGVIATLIAITSGLAMQHSWVLLATVLAGVLLPYMFFLPIQRKYGPLVHAYRANIQYIETYQHSRGWI